MQFGLKNTLSNPFAIQYVSLILIILTFVAGAFTSEPVAEKQSKLEESIQSEEPGQYKDSLSGISREVAELQLPEFFNRSRASFNRERGEALDFVLLSHDLEGEFEIATESDESGRNNEIDFLMLSMLRSKELLRHFEEQGIPLSAVKIYVREGASVSENESLTLNARLRHFLQ